MILGPAPPVGASGAQRGPRGGSPQDEPAAAPVLRAMRWWDAAAVAAAEQHLFGGDAWSEEAVWGELAAPGRWYVVAVEGETLLGYAGLAGPFERGGDADVATVAVLERAQRRGLGRTLLRALLAEAARRGAGSVLLEVAVGNAGAAALYAAEGFEKIAVRRRYYADGSDADVLRWRPRAGGGSGPDSVMT